MKDDEKNGWRVSLVFFVDKKDLAREMMDGTIAFIKQNYKIPNEDIKTGMRSTRSRW